MTHRAQFFLKASKRSNSDSFLLSSSPFRQLIKMTGEAQEIPKLFTINLAFDHGCMMRRDMKEELDLLDLQGKIQIKVNIESPWSYTPDGPKRASPVEVIRVEELSLKITPENKSERLEELLDQVCGRLDDCCGPNAPE